MDWGEFRFRAGQLVLMFGAVAYAATQITPLNFEKSQGIAFGLIAGLFLRGIYTVIRNGWDAADEQANKEGGFMLTTFIVAVLITAPYWT